MKNLIYYAFIFLFLQPLYAKQNTAIDKYHTILSNQVLYWSDYLDTKISNFITGEQSCPPGDTQINNTRTENIDAFFQNNKYINDTRDIYVRLRMNTFIYSRESNKINMRLSAQLPFDKCKKQFNLYFEDDNRRNEEIKSTDSSNTGVGIRYYGKEKFGIKSSYSLGMTRGSPYLRARYKLPIQFNQWKIEPVQVLQYSNKYYLSEESNIYFDKAINKADLFRIQLHRKSAYDLNGTDYGITFQYYKNFAKDAGLEITQSFFGNTFYNHFYKYDKNYSGINNYVSSVSWRQSVWRKWFYYEVKPSINFHKDHNYKASYGLHFLFDIYLGDYH